MALAWKSLEDQVRSVASLKWDRPTMPRAICGVNVDGVIELTPDHFICVEITKENNLAKLRGDLAKFATVRSGLWNTGIYAECYFVTESEPTQSIITSAHDQRITACSVAH